MAYSRESHELLEATLQEMIKEYGGNLAYPKMVGYLMVNVRLDDALRIAKHESDKREVA